MFRMAIAAQLIRFPTVSATAPLNMTCCLGVHSTQCQAHAHMLRHACGYKLANDGHDTRAIQAYLGHRNIQNTTRYTALAPQRFREFFRD